MGLRKFSLPDEFCRHITPVQGVGTFEILNDGTFNRGIGQFRP